MGEVWKARDTRLDRTVAVKVLPQHLSATSETRQRFEREAKTISQLSHPHICALYDVGNQDGVEYLVMEYLEGETLAERLARGALSLEQTLRFGVQIAEALERAHRQGIVHRDLKPGNIMLTKTGVKLVDFGLARMLVPASRSDEALTSIPTMAKAPLTQEGAILGTFQYMSPEQLEGKEADGRSDIFALGAVLYEMATGRKVFTGKSQASLITAIMSSEPAPISTVHPAAPAALDRIVRTCLAKDPEDRWQAAGDVAKELKWVGERAPAGASPAAERKASRRERIAWATAAILLLAGLYLAYEWRRSRSVEPAAVHSFLIPPENTVFHLTGDDSAPIVVSPDGQRAVFGAGSRLWIQSLRTGAVAEIGGPEGGKFPFWSADSRSIGFFSGGKLRVADASGGPIQTICDAPNARGGAWNAAGVIVFAPDIRTGLSRVSASGGQPAPLTRVERRHTTHRWPSFLPDGKHVLYLAANHANPFSEESGIYVAPLDGGEPKRLLSAYGSAQVVPGWILTVRDTSLMAQRFDEERIALSGPPLRVASDVNFDRGTWRGIFSVSANGLLVYQLAQTGVGGQLTWMDFSGRQLGSIGEKSEAYSPELSPNGRYASVILGDPNNDVWVYELDRGVRTRLTTEAQVNVMPVWSPDGTEILFSSYPKDPDEYVLYRMAPESGGERKVVYRSKERIEPSSWSRDGRYALVDRGNIGAAQLWAIPMADPARAFRVVQSPFPQTPGQFSPDGRWVAYCSQPTGRFEVYVTPFPGGGARYQVSAGGGLQPRWSPDGKRLYFVSPDSSLMAATVDGSGSRFEVREVRPLFLLNMFLGPRPMLYGYAVAPDGKRLLVNSAGEVGLPRVALVSNWTADLPK
jgi:eukaryotic-like serine/threonine-protein kinase